MEPPASLYSAADNDSDTKLGDIVGDLSVTLGKSEELILKAIEDTTQLVRVLSSKLRRGREEKRSRIEEKTHIECVNFEGDLLPPRLGKDCAKLQPNCEASSTDNQIVRKSEETVSYLRGGQDSDGDHRNAATNDSIAQRSTIEKELYKSGTLTETDPIGLGESPRISSILQEKDLVISDKKDRETIREEEQKAVSKVPAIKVYLCKGNASGSSGESSKEQRLAVYNREDFKSKFYTFGAQVYADETRAKVVPKDSGQTQQESIHNLFSVLKAVMDSLAACSRMADKLKSNVAVSRENLSGNDSANFVNAHQCPQIYITDHSEPNAGRNSQIVTLQNAEKVDKETQVEPQSIDHSRSADDLRNVVYEDVQSVHEPPLRAVDIPTNNEPCAEHAALSDLLNNGGQYSKDDTKVKKQKFGLLRNKSNATERGFRMFSKKLFSKSVKSSKMKASKSEEMLCSSSKKWQNGIVGSQMSCQCQGMYESIELTKTLKEIEIDNVALKEENRRLVERLFHLEMKTTNDEKLSDVTELSPIDANMIWDDTFDTKRETHKDVKAPKGLLYELSNFKDGVNAEDGNVSSLRLKLEVLEEDKQSLSRKLDEMFKENEELQDKIVNLRLENEAQVVKLKDENFSLRSRLDNLLNAKLLSERNHQKLKLTSKRQKAFEQELRQRCCELISKLDGVIQGCGMAEKESIYGNLNTDDQSASLKLSSQNLSQNILECFEYSPELSAEYNTTVKLTRADSKLSARGSAEIQQPRLASTKWKSDSNIYKTQNSGDTGGRDILNDHSNLRGAKYLVASEESLSSYSDRRSSSIGSKGNKEGKISRFPPVHSPIPKEKRREKGKPATTESARSGSIVSACVLTEEKAIFDTLDILERKCMLLLSNYNELKLRNTQRDEEKAILQERREEMAQELENMKRVKDQQDVMLVCLRSLQKENDSMKLNNLELRNSLDRVSGNESARGDLGTNENMVSSKAGVHRSLATTNAEKVNGSRRGDLVANGNMVSGSPGMRRSVATNAMDSGHGTRVGLVTNGDMPRKFHVNGSAVSTVSGHPNSRVGLVKRENISSYSKQGSATLYDQDTYNHQTARGLVNGRGVSARSVSSNDEFPHHNAAEQSYRGLYKINENKPLEEVVERPVEYNVTVDSYCVTDDNDYWFEEECFAAQVPSPEPLPHDRNENERWTGEELTINDVQLEIEDDFERPYMGENQERSGLPADQINGTDSGLTYGVAIAVQKYQLKGAEEGAGNGRGINSYSLSGADRWRGNVTQAVREDRPLDIDKRFRSKSVKTRKASDLLQGGGDYVNEHPHAGTSGGQKHNCQGEGHQCNSILSLLTKTTRKESLKQRDIEGPRRPGGGRLRKALSTCRGRDRLYKVHYV